MLVTNLDWGVKASKCFDWSVCQMVPEILFPHTFCWSSMLELTICQALPSLSYCCYIWSWAAHQCIMQFKKIVVAAIRHGSMCFYALNMHLCKVTQRRQVARVSVCLQALSCPIVFAFTQHVISNVSGSSAGLNITGEKVGRIWTSQSSSPLPSRVVGQHAVRTRQANPGLYSDYWEERQEVKNRKKGIQNRKQSQGGQTEAKNELNTGRIKQERSRPKGV